jgi:hypothetical protein
MSEHASHLPVGYSAYANSKCRCDGCRAAWAAYCLDLKKGRSERPDLHPVPHGTNNGYRNYGCRCDECTAAGTAGEGG